MLACSFYECSNTLSPEFGPVVTIKLIDVFPILFQVSYLQKFCGDSLSLMAPILQVATLNEKS